MNKTTIKKIKESGYKQEYLAMKIGITPNYLSMCINGARTLAGHKEAELNNFLDKNGE